MEEVVVEDEERLEVVAVTEAVVEGVEQVEVEGVSNVGRKDT